MRDACKVSLLVASCDAAPADWLLVSRHDYRNRSNRVKLEPEIPVLPL